MEIINKNDILDCLKNSILYQELTDNDNNQVTVQNRYIINDLKIEDDKDFFHKLDTLRYWMVNKVPYEIYDYLIDHKVDISQYKDFNYEMLSLFNNFKTNEYWIISLITKTGDLDLLKHLVNTNRIKLNKMMYNEVVKEGHLEMLKYLYEQLGEFDNFIHYYTCVYNQFECLKYICEQDKEKVQKDISTYETLRSTKDNFKCLEYLHNNFEIKLSDKIMLNGIKSHNMKYVKFLEDNGLNTLNNATFELVDYAIKYNNVEVLKIIYSRNPVYANIITAQQFNVTVTNECIDCLKYLHELVNFQQISPYVINTAIFNLSYYTKCKCLKYLAEKGDINKEIAYYYACISEDKEAMSYIKPKYTPDEIELMNKNMNTKFNIYDLSKEVRYFPGIIRFKNISVSNPETYENDYFKMACVPNAQGELVPLPSEIKFEDEGQINTIHYAHNKKFFLVKELFDCVCDYGESEFSNKNCQTFFNRLIHKRDNVYSVGWKCVKINAPSNQ